MGRRLVATGHRSLSRTRTFARTLVDDHDRFRLALASVSLLAGLLVLLVATQLFPYLSVNHDEGVYLQQAAMLLDGKLWLTPPVPDAVRPWFFVQDGGRLYAKYSPVAPAMFAPALALGVPRLALAAIAAGNVALVGLLGAEAFDRKTGLLAAALVPTAPLFVFTSSAFLSYAPTTLLNLLFALGYVRALRSETGQESRRYAVLAGLAAGLAFFARPYTAVLFAAPFVCHALLVLGGEAARRERLRAAVTRLGTVAALGTALVGVTLSYNWLQTGDPLVFPYQAFAPEDGIGFGHREILSHERMYTPALALRANAQVLRALLGWWGPLGIVGSALAAVGLARGFGVAAWRDRPWSLPRVDRLSDTGLRALVAGVGITVPLGNVYFWGNLNVLARIADPTDGLIAHLGPFYHFDMLLVLAVFGAAGLVALGRWVGALTDAIERQARGPASGRTAARFVLAVVLVGSLVVAGTVAAGTFGPPTDRNAAYTDDLETVYEPFDSGPPENALVFVPTPYGPWLQHPFQWLRNDPAFEQGPVYVQNRGVAGDLASLRAFEGRQPYRFTYRGNWPPGDERLLPVLEPLSVKQGQRIAAVTRIGVVTGAQGATIRLAADGESVQYGVQRLPDGTLPVEWVIGPESARVRGENLQLFSESASVPIDGPTTVSLAVTFTQPGGATVTYRQEVTVGTDGEQVRALWPPETRVCRLQTDCGREGAYVEGGDYVGGVSITSNATAVSGKSRSTPD